MYMYMSYVLYVHYIHVRDIVDSCSISFIGYMYLVWATSVVQKPLNIITKTTLDLNCTHACTCTRQCISFVVAVSF